MSNVYVIGVDVGTGSARAALVDSSNGKVIKVAEKAIEIWNPLPNHYEQSSDDIWKSVCYCVKTVTEGIPNTEVVAISFAATCSLVLLGENGESISASTTRNYEQNVILWMDHRAQIEAEQINTTKHELLNYVGGQVSLEMEMPKLLWLRKNAYPTWTKLWRAFDLVDFLTWRSTNSDSRSLCTVVCKWNYDATRNRWDTDFLRQIGLEELRCNDFEIIGNEIRNPGEPVGQGLSQRAAKDFKLRPGTVVGTALIDAHAGMLGMLGCRPNVYNQSPCQGMEFELQSKLGLICGSSTCHMSMTREPCLAQGIWGPYKGAILPDYYLNEAGQSATGLLLDNMFKLHPQYEQIKSRLKPNSHIYTYLNRLLVLTANEKGLKDPCFLTKDVHVWPDFHGNRSPIADPNLRGMISGMGMNDDEETLAILYLSFVHALAYGTRHIIENLNQFRRGKFNILLFCGGLAKNPLYVQTHADVCHLPAIVPNESEMVLVGASMLGACAAKIYPTLEEAAAAMSGNGKLLRPNVATQIYHDRKYRVFLEMLQNQRKYKSMMDSN